MAIAAHHDLECLRMYGAEIAKLHLLLRPTPLKIAQEETENAQ